MSSSRRESATISQSIRRKTMFLLFLGFALVVAWVTIMADEQLRERLGSNLYIIGFSITGCFLLMLTGYLWDQTLVKALRSLHDTTSSIHTLEPMITTGEETDSDEIIGLARKIEHMARSLQHVEANYKGIVEDQADLICRYEGDGKLTFVNGAYARAVNRKRNDLVSTDFPYF